MCENDGMTIAEVLAVLDAFRRVGCRFWLEGGWGVDALVGRQTRPHRDVDVDFDAAYETGVLQQLAELGYAIETDWRPNRVELAATGRGCVDLHPLVLDDEGAARQAALDGGWHEFTTSWFTTGTLQGVTVPGVSAEAQRRFRSGYELRQVDLHDLGQLDRLDQLAHRSERAALGSVGGPLVQEAELPASQKAQDERTGMAEGT